MMHDLQPPARSSAACAACCNAGWRASAIALWGERIFPQGRAPTRTVLAARAVSLPHDDRDSAERPRNAMKVLFLVQKEQRAILDRLYDGVAANCECDLRWLTDDDQRNLRRYFKREVRGRAL
jgi:hypothetical protein